MAVSLKLADAYVDISVDISKFAADLSKVKAMLGALGGAGGGGVAQGMAAGIAAGVAQGVVQGSGQARNALGQFTSQGVAAGVTAGMARGVAGARASAAPLGQAVQQAVASGMAAGAAQGARGLPARDALGRFTAGPGGGGGAGGGFGGFGAAAGQGAMGFAQGLGIGSFAVSPAQMLGQMAGKGLKDAVGTAMELQSTFLDLQRVTGGSAENMGKLKKEVFEIAAKQAGVSVSDVTGIMMGAAKAGVGDKEGDAGLVRFTKGIARIKNAMGEGEGLNAEQLTNDTTKILTVFGLGTEAVEGFGSALVRMANVSTASGADIVQTTKTLSGTFKSLNVDVGMAMSIGSVIADVGLTNQQGANAMSQFLRNMASGSAEMAEKIGMPIEQFQEKVRTDAIGAFQIVLEKFKEINAVDPIKGQEFVKGLGYEGIRAAGAFQQMSSMIGEMQSRAKLAREEMGSLAALTAADVLKGTASESGVLKLKNAFVELGDAIGTHFLGPMDAVTGRMTAAVRGLAGSLTAEKLVIDPDTGRPVRRTQETSMGGFLGLTMRPAAPPPTEKEIADRKRWDDVRFDKEQVRREKEWEDAKRMRTPAPPAGPVRVGAPGTRAEQLAAVEAENQRRREAAAVRPVLQGLAADMVEDIGGGVGNMLNFPSRSQDVGGIAAFGPGARGLEDLTPTDAERMRRERDRERAGVSLARPGGERDFSKMSEFAKEFMTPEERQYEEAKEKIEQDKRKRSASQMFGDSSAYATDAIQKAITGRDKTPEEQLVEAKKANDILTRIADRILPPTRQNEGMFIFTRP